MSWDADFVDRLSLGARGLRYILRVIEVDGLPGTAWAIASHPGLGDEVGLSTQGIDEYGATVGLRGSTTTIGAFNCVLVGRFDGFFAHASRGTVVALEVGFPDQAEADFARVALGMVKSLRGQGGPSARLEVFDLFALFRGRCTLEFGVNLLGDPTNSIEVVDSDFNPGDTTMKVDDPSLMLRETGGTGMVRVTPLSGAAFYATFTGTGTTPNRLTGVTGGVHGTTAVLAEIGSVVESVLYLRDHPIDAARKLCCSTGFGTNGTYDTLPMMWGLGIPDEFWDHDDADNTAGLMGSFTPYPWEMVAMGPQENGLQWLQSKLSLAGLVLTMHQGALTIRAMQDPEAATTVYDITDADILRVDDYESWDVVHPMEYAHVRAIHDGNVVEAGTAADTLATLPSAPSAASVDSVGGIFDIQLGDLLWGTNAVDACEEVLSRMEVSLRRIPEKIRIRARLSCAVLSPLDVVTLTTRRIQSRANGSDGFLGQRAVITTRATNWSEGHVMLEMRVYPAVD